MRVPKSYLSSAIHGKAELSADQLFLAAEFLELPSAQRSYLLLLLEHDRSTVKARKHLLHEEIVAIQEANLETKAHLKAQVLSPERHLLHEYFSDPVNQLVHVTLAIPRLKGDGAKVAEALGLPKERVLRSLQQLQQLGVVEVIDGKYKVVVETIHLPPGAAQFSGWRSQVRVNSLQRLGELSGKAGYSLSVTFSGTPALREDIQRRFLDLLKAVEPKVAQAASEEAYQMNFDLFPWTTE